MGFNSGFKGLNTELNPICHLLALFGAHPIFHVGRVRVKNMVIKYYFQQKSTESNRTRRYKFRNKKNKI